MVATSSLDLGIDWAAVDLVVQVGAPKGVSRLLQRIGRANHRLDEASRAVLVPANRFEVLECRAAVQAIEARTLDGDPPQARRAGRAGPAHPRHGLRRPLRCRRPLSPRSPAPPPTPRLTRKDFDDTLNFVATGGYALGSYDRFKRLVRNEEDGLYRVAGPVVARQYRMNVGTIVEAVTLKVRLGRGQILGEIEEHFVQSLVAGDTFLFAGQLLKFLGITETWVNCAQGGQGDPKIPAYAGGKMPLSTHLADRVRAMLSDPACWRDLPDAVQEWLRLQRLRSVLPNRDDLLVETFPRGKQHFMVAYCFEGRNAHQTLGMLLTRRMERAKLKPLGFVATDYVLSVWSLAARSPTSTACSIRTCWATTWKPGWTSPACCAGPSATWR